MPSTSRIGTRIPTMGPSGKFAKMMCIIFTILLTLLFNRVWYLNTNTVRTLVGQPNRQVGDGLVTSSIVGASAVWGIVVGKGWVGWTEADKHSLRISSPGTSTMMTMSMPCSNGQYFSTLSNSCIQCTNRIPIGTTYLTSGSVDANDCPWTCPDPPEFMPFTCPEFSSAVNNAKLGTPTVGSSSEVNLSFF